MRILIAVEERRPRTYVDYLLRGLEDEGADVVCSAARFDEPDPSFDVLHLQWPEELCGWSSPSPERVERIRHTLERWRSEAGAVRIATRHNALPHLHRGDDARRLYEVVHGTVDGIVHLGSAGRDALEAAYGCPQVVIPHGWYPHADPVPRNEARERLEIGRDRFVVLVFGAIRRFAEKRLILGARDRVRVPGAEWIVPRWHEATQPSWTGRPLRRILAVVADLRARGGMRVDDGLVPEDRVGDFFGASDVVFLPRIDALNSGVLFLAFSHARPVAGPDTGNIEEVLRETGNPIYAAGDPDDAARALDSAAGLDLERLGAANRRWARTRCGWAEIARRHVAFYRTLGAEPPSRPPP